MSSVEANNAPIELPKMRIIHVGPQSGIGGIAYLYQRLDEGLRSAGFQVINIDTAHGGKIYNSGLVARLFLTLNVVVAIFWHMRRANSRQEKSICHIHTSSGKAFWEKSLFLWVAKMGRGRVVLHINGGAFDEFVQSAGAVPRWAMTLVLRNAAAVIVTSEYWKGLLESEVAHSGSGIRLEVVPNVVDARQLARSNVGSRRSKSRSEMTVLFIGSIGRRKGCFELLEVAAETAAHGLNYVLLGTEEFKGERRAVRDEAARMGLTNIEFPGYADEREKEQHFNGSDVFFLPSNNENMPLAILEAMAAGLPVVATSVGAIPEVVDDEGGRLTAPGDTGAMREALLMLKRESKTRSRMGAHNRRIVLDRYSIEAAVERLRDVYMSIV